MLPVTVLITSAFRLIVAASSVTAPLNFATPLTLMTSPDWLPALTCKLVLPCALSALAMLTVSLPEAAVVSIVMAELRTRTFSKAVPPVVPEICKAGVVPSVKVLLATFTLLPALGSETVMAPAGHVEIDRFQAGE